MIDALGTPQHVLVLGGTSDIGVAVVERYLVSNPALTVSLAARPGTRRTSRADELRGRGATVHEIDLEAVEDGSAESAVAQAAGVADIDVAVVAVGLLGDPEMAWQDVATGIELARVNYVAPVACGIALAACLRTQGHGVIVALSSVAGERPRRSNFVYGSTKAGMDAFYTGLGEALRGSGARVLVVRPGFVHSRMTHGLDPAPLAASLDQVAEAVVRAVTDGREQIWVPGALRAVMIVLRHLPRAVFRRLPI